MRFVVIYAIMIIDSRLYRFLVVAVLLVAAGAVAVPSARCQDALFAHGEWYKMAIPSSGVYRVAASSVGALAGSPVSALAMYGMPGGQLPMANSQLPTDDYAQLPIVVNDVNQNGVFDGSDYLLFYAEGASVWRYSSSEQFVAYSRSTYADNNYCYLTNSAAPGSRVPVCHGVATNNAASCYTAVGVVDNDLVNTAHSGQIWVGERFNNTTRTRTIMVDVPQMVQQPVVKYRYAAASISTAAATFTIALNGHSDEMQIARNGFYRSGLGQFAASGSGPLSFTLTYTPQESGAAGYLDYLQVNVPAQLRYAGKMMDMWSFDPSLHLKYTIANAPAGMQVWDVSDPMRPLQMDCTNATFADSTLGVHHYVAFAADQVSSPASIVRMEQQNLRGAVNPNMVIVSHPSFVEQAERLADIHRLIDGMEVLVATPQQVWDEFSSGRQDPMGLRRMMRYYWKRSQADASLPQTQYLLLLGDGTYDNRNINGNNKGCIVTYQTPTSFDDENSSYCSDMILGYLDDAESGRASETVDIAIGRLPASTVAEARHMVDKIERYIYREDLQTGSGRGDWRNYVTLLADDADPSCAGDTSFTTSSEYTAKQIQARYPQMNVEKVYADAFVQQSGAVGSYYPDVNNALRNRVNYGTLVFNYVGHGSVQYIGTERYVSISDIDAYSNTDRLFLFVGSTCSYGRYDNPEVVCGSEAMLLAQNGAVGVLSASRPISHDRLFNTAVNVNLLNPEMTVGEALRVSQNGHHQSLSIGLLGDPALRLSLPQKEVVVTKVNGVEVSEGVADTARVLSRVTVEGEIRNSDGTLAEGFDGAIYPIVYDRKQRSKTLANDNEDCHVAFDQQKAVLYKGRDTVAGGRFSYSFVVPRDVAYEFDYGRLSHYAKSGTIDASGSYSNVVFGGFDQTVDLSECRPEIRLYMGDSNFVDGGVVDQEPVLYAVLYDSVGINAFGSGLGHDITAVVDGKPNSVVSLNDFYETDAYDARKGYVTYALDKLGRGLHSLTLKAWNIFNYSNTATITFEVRTSDTAQLGRFYAYPNPAVAEAVLHAEFNTASALEKAEVEIFTLQGQRVASFAPQMQSGSYVVGPIRWDLRNEAGNKVLKGMYLARIRVLTTDGEWLTENTKIIVY